MKKFFVLLVLCLIFQEKWLHSQQQFRLYGVHQGLSHSVVNTIFQGPKGFIWAGTAIGLSRFDGLQFIANPTLDSLPADFVSTSFTDANGDIWLGHNDGSLTFFDGENFKIVSPSEQTRSRVVGIAEDKSGRIFAATQRAGIIVVNQNLMPVYIKNEFSDLVISSIAYLPENGFLIGTFAGLYIVEFNKGIFENRRKIEEVPSTNIQVIKFDEVNRVSYLGTQDLGMIVLNHNEKTISRNKLLHEKLNQLNIQDILLKENGIIWLSTFGSGLIQVLNEFENDSIRLLASYNTTNGLPGDYVKQVITDFEGNMWIATFGEGLAYMVDKAFTLINDFGEKFGNSVFSIARQNEIIYLGGHSGIIQFLQGKPQYRKFWGREYGLPADNITGIAADSYGNLYIGTASSGIYVRLFNTNYFRLFYFARNSLANNIQFLTIDGRTLWVATNAGVLSFALPDNTPSIFNTEYGLPYNSVRQIHIVSPEKVWVATKGARIFSILDRQQIEVANIEIDFTSIAYDNTGRMWAATLGHGLILVESDSLVQITQDEGLLNNFCYSLAFDNDGNAWVSHRLGLSRINSNNLRVRTFGRDVGIEGDGNFNSILNTPKGELFVGTTQGLVIFNHLKAKELPPPKTNITAVYISDQLVDHSKPINLPPGAYKLRIEFTGISFSNPEKVRYQYKLVGHDLDWGSVTSNNWALYPRIEDGNYRFVLNAFNADGVATEEPVELIISVRKPVWKQTWFHALLLIIAVIGVILIVKIREKAHKQKEKYLEEELGRRAGELKQKNTELHKKNKDITDSINYAKRIQSSILPPIHKIEIWFPGSFVFYSPRDIVSGDFYWFEIVNDSKFLIVCADSTGHGVPGAFMSIIGATLIKDIAMRFNVNSPSEILTMLDYEVAAMLNLPEVAEGVNSSDGMDLTVCEIDINTNYLRFASAMRPIMLYHKKELIYIKGSRNAIGGQNTNVKEFETQGYQLEKGDLIYMFTDGFSDQFGGPFGKKYKIVRLKNLLADICTMPVEKQELMIVNEFNSWKGDQEQVDDVLFMCIKI